MLSRRAAERWQKLERDMANHFDGGRRQPGSGNQVRHKGDVKSKRFLIEAKRTDKDSISIQKKWVQKIREEAAREGKDPLIVMEINGERVYVLPATTFDHLLGDKL